uniref:Secreted protein n=1 Tax=Heterorhabditis bacteriophora TaxID=37862 RepID=A0A1I7WJC4_HETBA
MKSARSRVKGFPVFIMHIRLLCYVADLMVPPFDAGTLDSSRCGAVSQSIVSDSYCPTAVVPASSNKLKYDGHDSCITHSVPLLIFHEFVTPYKRGFYCDDESIRYPFRNSTVSRQALIVVGLIIPTALFVKYFFKFNSFSKII